jgi:hypothetical protein
MKAIRIFEQVELDDSRMCYWKDENGLWWLYIPGCGAGVLSNHTVVENEDKTITVTPSILMAGHHGTQRHGYLTNGEWREC